MTIIYDMANGTIQSEAREATGASDIKTVAAPETELHLAQHEFHDSSTAHSAPQPPVHLIRGLPESD
jgi:carbohydrate-binding DOMON domain-containing protein